MLPPPAPELGVDVEPVMMGWDWPTMISASLLWVVTMVGAERTLNLLFTPWLEIKASKARGLTTPLVTAQLAFPLLSSVAPVAPKPVFAMLPPVTWRFSAEMPVVSLSVRVTSAMTTSMRTWARMTSILSTSSRMRRMSSPVPLTTMALLRSSEATVSRELNSVVEGLAELLKPVLLAGVAGAAGVLELVPGCTTVWPGRVEPLLALVSAAFWPVMTVPSRVATSLEVACLR